MDDAALFSAPHRRLNALTGEWLLVSPHRTQRPWQGQVEATPAEQRPAYDPACYLCPGNQRAGGVHTPDYSSTFVFDNDFAALLPDTAARTLARARDEQPGPALLRAESERGICRVVCFSPRHDLTLAGMDTVSLRQVVDTWADQYAELGAIPWVRYVQIFENRGAMMGASNPHPHGQIWANERVPNEPAKETQHQHAYTAASGSCLLCDYLALELRDGQRIVCQNEHFVALVPFWAIWPFETLVLPRAHHGALTDLPPDARDDLAGMLRQVTRCYDQLFQVSFPYSMGLHQRPTNDTPYPEWHLHGHFYPPLLRSATVRKFMVGYELLSQPQRDITPEGAAERLRSLVER
jgi:UDPglucose--hexose-1-phosphate uridylyltransferase